MTAGIRPWLEESRLRVFLADDNPVVRKGLRAFLEAEPGVEVVGEAANGESALAAILSLKPDVAMLDLQMPGLSGLEVARKLSENGSGTAVVILSMHAEHRGVTAALAAGALGYVVKDDAATNLIRAIQAASRGEAYLSPSIAPEPGQT